MNRSGWLVEGEGGEDKARTWARYVNTRFQQLEVQPNSYRLVLAMDSLSWDISKGKIGRTPNLRWEEYVNYI